MPCMPEPRRCASTACSPIGTTAPPPDGSPLSSNGKEQERARRSLERRLKEANIVCFKPPCDFDWSWPKSCDQSAIEALMTLEFLNDATNAILVGPNGIGKTMILKNVAQHALSRGHTVRFTTASDMLAELAAQDSSSILARRLRRYTTPQLLCIDEVGW